MTARPIRYQRQVSDRKGKIFYTSITSLSHISKMVGNKTAIYISHRLASCKFCEDILVFDKGQVVQHGSHETLMKEKGLYEKLWNAQAGYYA